MIVEPGDTSFPVDPSELTRRHARSFHFASKLLAPDARQDACAVYAFCRVVDDLTDQQPAATAMPGERAAAVELSSSLLDAAYLGLRVADSRWVRVGHDLRTAVRRRGIPRDLLETLVAGCAADLCCRRFDSWPRVEEYCYSVAGVVGLVMCHVFGVADPAARRHAVTVGNAMQLTNILRDIPSDLALGRLYLPLDELRAAGVSEADLGVSPAPAHVRRLVAMQVSRARALFAEGSLGLAAIPTWSCRCSAAAMVVLYAGILDAIEDADYDPTVARAHLRLGQKLLRLPRAIALAAGLFPWQPGP